MKNKNGFGDIALDEVLHLPIHTILSDLPIEVDLVNRLK